MDPLTRFISPTNSRMLAPARQFLLALGGWWRAFGYMRHHGLRRFHLAGPGALLLITWAGIGLSERLSAWLRSSVLEGLASLGFNPEPLAASPDAGWTQVLLWSASLLEWMLEWGVALMVLWLKVKVTKYLLLTLMAPIMSALAAAVRNRETGTSVPFSVRQLMRDLLRGLRTATVLLSAEIALTLVLALTTLLLSILAAPLAFLLSPVLLVLGWVIGAYFFGAAVFDAVYEQAGLDWSSSLRTGWKDRYSLIGIGAVFSLLLAVPFIGVLLATLLGPMPCTVAAARLTFHPVP